LQQAQNRAIELGGWMGPWRVFIAFDGPIKGAILVDTMI
jgi:hypothetical protein